ncbi:MAG: DUF4922 domain-containing protein [Acidobacteria bacterium]|nr:DUF4922 domain-containing protein [Acidobacteriota bacterium]
MSWDHRILTDAELMPATPDNLLSRVKALMAQQKTAWPQLRDAISGFDEMRYQRLLAAGSVVLAQNNPRRIISTAARVDSATIKERPCFLCPENLPPEEKGIAFKEDFVILCNPFPVLKNHLVITSRLHTPQTVIGNIGHMLDLAGRLGDEWFVLYNGPQCGASAPDHLHFQACSKDNIPIFDEIETWKRKTITRGAGIEVFTLSDYRLNLLAARCSNPDTLVRWFNEALKYLQNITGSLEEPLINIIIGIKNGELTLVVFPREKHRPDCFFAEGDAKLTVSPASIDLAGVLVVPDPGHFDKITDIDAGNIFREVTLNDSQFEEWVTNQPPDDQSFAPAFQGPETHTP